MPAALVLAGAAVGAALYSERDIRLYYEIAVPAAPILIGGLAALAVVGLRRRHLARLARAKRETAIRAESSLAARNERGRLIRRLDHEIKNPVTAIRAGLANVSAAPLPPEAAAAVASVDEQALRLARLIGDLRKLADLEQAELDRTTVDLAEVCNDVAAAVGDLPGAHERMIEVVVPEVPWRVGAIQGDPDLLFLAVMNLVSNALKFSAPGKRIELWAVEEDRHAVIEVADNGVGIPPDELPHMWEELARGEAARAVPGSGIGLALVRTIVERHGGDASIRSRLGGHRRAPALSLVLTRRRTDRMSVGPAAAVSRVPRTSTEGSTATPRPKTRRRFVCSPAGSSAGRYLVARVSAEGGLCAAKPPSQGSFGHTNAGGHPRLTDCPARLGRRGPSRQVRTTPTFRDARQGCRPDRTGWPWLAPVPALDRRGRWR